MPVGIERISVRLQLHVVTEANFGWMNQPNLVRPVIAVRQNHSLRRSHYGCFRSSASIDLRFRQTFCSDTCASPLARACSKEPSPLFDTPSLLGYHGDKYAQPWIFGFLDVGLPRYLLQETQCSWLEYVFCTQTLEKKLQAIHPAFLPFKGFADCQGR